ncbi:hypothetical protein CkaCkLH20_02267 [Colletotrichum karsti]|uniref:Uncharacterized protein n=1 Tax=Colletotrichum karsti TaxID=1095194 RepID=A0A9P6IAV9_9PEZI|nr:uncharacterized protein CkaCkLH20_02267 [Colletotrichum karsti]KAF9880313.1 hypothetical protein CkaCkLH20_02267 [Colletotrichum karsti]
MSFPDPKTYVPATAPCKRGPSLNVRIPQEIRFDAEFKRTIDIPNLSLDDLVEEVSKQPLPQYAAYSRELAQVSGFAMEHSGDHGKMDYLHWEMCHGSRPAGPWDLCPCENVIFELPDLDEEPLTIEELEQRMYGPQEMFDASSNYGPVTAEISSALLEDFFSPYPDLPEGFAEDDTSVAANTRNSAALDTNVHLQFPTLRIPTSNEALNPAAPSFQMTDISNILRSPVQFEQPEQQHNAGQ